MSTTMHSGPQHHERRKTTLETAGYVAGMGLGGLCGLCSGAVLGAIAGPFGIGIGGICGLVSGVIAGATLSEFTIEALETK